MSKSIDDIIRDVLENYKLDNDIHKFFLSTKKAIIFGNGNQAHILYDMCKLLHKKVLFFLVTEKDINNNDNKEGVPCKSIEDVRRIDNCDIIFALNEQYYSDVEFVINNYLYKYMFNVDVYRPKNWNAINSNFENIRNLLCHKYIEYNEELKYAYYKKHIYNDKNKKIYIHIGSSKAGSSTIQSFLYNNREALNNEGVYYARTLNGYEQHVDFADFYARPWKNNNLFGKYIYFFDIYTNKCKAAVISSEFFTDCYYDDSIFDIFIDNFDVTFIFYMRNPLEYANSTIQYSAYNYADSVQKEFPLDVISLNKIIQFPINRLEKYKLSTNNYNFILKNFDKKKDNLCNDFLSILGIDGANFSDVGVMNKLLKINVLFFLLHISLIPLLLEKKRKIINELIIISKNYPNNTTYTKPYRIFSRKQIEQIPLEIIRKYKYYGKVMNDPDFWDRGVDAMLKLEQVPWRQLPEDQQYEIFEQLSSESQQAILDVWPIWQDLPGRLRGSHFLPDIPETEEDFRLLHLWLLHARERLYG